MNRHGFENILDQEILDPKMEKYQKCGEIPDLTNLWSTDTRNSRILFILVDFEAEPLYSRIF